ncbi:MAG TPA: NUDIX domain-containing protein [Actinotalea sp.]|jgi:ADP-ribose pyrophosphatase YjhB (NUDIX family)
MAAPGELQPASRVAAYAVVRRDDAVLLVRASPRSDVPGTWWLPGGGVEFGEDPADAVVRELHEETGLVGRVSGLLDVVSDVMPIPARSLALHTVRVLYAVDVASGELVTERDGSSDLAAWVDLAQAVRLPLLPFVRALLTRLPEV